MPAVLPPRRSRRWIGFFLILAVLSTGAIVVPFVYNLRMQLRPEQLAEARQRWQENAPANYDLEYLIRTTHAGQEEESQYRVLVRGGRAVLIVDNGDVVYLDPSLALVAGPSILASLPADAGQYGVPALFARIEATLRQDEAAGRRSFATAQFDPKDGHPFHYVHREQGTKERVEWNVKMTRMPR
ncbi:MAG TPA: hypothetical protein VE999_09580 [Gemmataceae bacterium]|nr:hypothetical protein [Gemmataceae bacterium]